MFRKMLGMVFLPLLYACIVGTVFHRWVSAHPIIANGIFIFLCALPVLYLIGAIAQKARRMVYAYRLWKRRRKFGY
ncbi:hypothetical protein LJC60_06725 [Ruminococcaceae bacterium OttesenSCG-928-D13]|nr:hypothetical protein [Ruminococcaceae bacterium OttesenSCG-928-D13]